MALNKKTLTGTSLSYDYTLGYEWLQINATGNVALTISNISLGAVQGTFYQDATGSRTLTINGQTVSVNTTANSVTWWAMGYDGTTTVVDSNYGNSNAPDTTAPTILFIGTTSSTAIHVVFSESVTLASAGWSFTLAGSAHPISSVIGSGAEWSFVMASTHTAGQTITYSYDPSTGNTIDLAGNELAFASGGSVQNNFFTGPLDEVTTAAVAYGLRRLVSTYTGPLVTVRRSTDNVTKDIGFTADGNFDTTTFTNFIGGAQGYVTTWYDQTGNAKHAAQSTSALQPELKLNIKNGKPALYFNSYYLTIASSSSYFIPLHNGSGGCSVNAILQPGTVADPAAGYGIIGTNGGSSAQVGYSIWFEDRVGSGNNKCRSFVTHGSGNNVIDSSADNILTANTFSILNHLFTPISTPASGRTNIYINNGAALTTNSATATTTSNGASSYSLQIGAIGNNALPFVGYMCELIIYFTKINTTQKDTLLTNQNSFYAIY